MPLLSFFLLRADYYICEPNSALINIIKKVSLKQYMQLMFSLLLTVFEYNEYIEYNGCYTLLYSVYTWHFTLLYFILCIHGILHYQKNITCISGLDVGKHQPGCNISQIHNGKHKNYRVDCNGRSLNKVPSCNRFPFNCGLVTELLLCHNQINDLPSSVFTDFTNLKLLDISHNPVDRIQNGTFIGLYKLTGLRMVGLKPEGYVTVEKDAFRTLTSLKWVNMKYSQKKQTFVTLLTL